MAQNISKARKVFQSQNLLGDDLLEDDNDLTACSLLFQILTNPSRFFGCFVVLASCYPAGAVT